MWPLYGGGSIGHLQSVTISRQNKQTVNQWLEGQRGKPQFRPAPTAGQAVAKVLRPLNKKYSGGASASMLHKHWPDIIGQRWSKISTPVKFTGNKDGRTLVISAPGAAATLIVAASGAILERLNAHLGDGHVKRLRVVQTRLKTSKTITKPKRGLTPTQENKLQDGLSKLPQGGLKQALEKLGRGVLTDDT